jgi:hypothetical protein
VPRDLAIVGYVDSDFATNKETRKSTTGFLVTFGGCLVSWSSKAQPSVTLSSTEAEYVAASMCGTEIKFISMLLDELQVAYPKPSMLFEDNTGAIFIMNNDQVGQRTKHIDVKWHHIRDMIKAGDLLVVYIRSEDNPADIMTKNTKEALFIKHALSMKKGVLLVGSLNREDVVDMVDRELIEDVRRTDEGIFVCVGSVPSPASLTRESSNGDRSIGIPVQDNASTSHMSSDGGNNKWVTVMRRSSKKSGLHRSATRSRAVEIVPESRDR